MPDWSGRIYGVQNVLNKEQPIEEVLRHGWQSLRPTALERVVIAGRVYLLPDVKDLLRSPWSNIRCAALMAVCSLDLENCRDYALSGLTDPSSGVVLLALDILNPYMEEFEVAEHVSMIAGTVPLKAMKAVWNFLYPDPNNLKENAVCLVAATVQHKRHRIMGVYYYDFGSFALGTVMLLMKSSDWGLRFEAAKELYQRNTDQKQKRVALAAIIRDVQNLSICLAWRKDRLSWLIKNYASVDILIRGIIRRGDKWYREHHWDSDFPTSDYPMAIYALNEIREAANEKLHRIAWDALKMSSYEMQTIALDLLKDSSDLLSRKEFLFDLLVEWTILNMVRRWRKFAYVRLGEFVLDAFGYRLSNTELQHPDEYSRWLLFLLRIRPKDVEKFIFSSLERIINESCNNDGIVQMFEYCVDADVSGFSMETCTNLFIRLLNIDLGKTKENTVRVVRLTCVCLKQNLPLVTHASPDSCLNITRRLQVLARCGYKNSQCELLSALLNWGINKVSLPVLIDACFDRDNSVAKIAKNGLEEQGHGPALERIYQDIDSINNWASREGWYLLRRPVRVQQFREGLGRTKVVKKDQPVTIEISAEPLFSQHPDAGDVMRGLALHELGHHAADIGQPGYSTMNGIARSEGIAPIYDLLRDERLERIIRSCYPSWGVYFDRLGSYAFAGKTLTLPLGTYAKWLNLPIEDLAARLENPDDTAINGQMVTKGAWVNENNPVVFRAAELVFLPGLFPVWTLFMICLRCGMDPRRAVDDRIPAAVQAVPAHLRRLSHSGVLEVARRIAEILEWEPEKGSSEDWMKKQQAAITSSVQARLGGNTTLDEIAGDIVQALTESRILPGVDRSDVKNRKNRIHIIYEPPTRNHVDDNDSFGQILNLADMIDFPRLDKTEKLEYDSSRHSVIKSSIRRHIQRLRRFLEDLGRTEEELPASLRGYRLDPAQVKKAVLPGTLRLMVGNRELDARDLYLGILIDRSGSMNGKKMELAKAFAVLLGESAGHLSGIEGHVNAFDDNTFYTLGTLKNHAAASLEAGGGNNDSGALLWAAELALMSRRKKRLIVMISDGYPAECSFASLKALVETLTRKHGILCAQVAVYNITNIAFPHFTDLSQMPFDEAVSHFGRMIRKLVLSFE